MRLEREAELQECLAKFLSGEGPTLLEVILDLDQEFAPKLASKKLDDGTMVTAELEDMTPLLGDNVMQQIREEALTID
jgi:acetolactate synthase-1/2/3 large subunit